MGILKGLFRNRDKPKNSTAGSSYRFLLGEGTAGKNVNERSAMQMTAVYSCVRILSEAVAGLPLHLYKYTDSGSKKKALDHSLYFLLHDEPNPEMTSFAFALAGKIDLIITKSVSRFARNTVDSLVTIRKLKEKGIEVYFEKENIWTFDSKGELLLTIMSSLAQEESRGISENVTFPSEKTIL